MNKNLALIEDFTRYDQSAIWNIHQEYFLNTGIKAWTQGDLPYSGVSNYLEASKKAQLLIENLKFQTLRTENIYIVEVGAGLGEFAYNFLQAFEEICKKENLNFFERLKYIFTDFSIKTIEEVASSNKLEKFKKNIQYVKYDILSNKFTDCKNIEQSSEIDFPNIQVNAILANYLLDQLPARVLAKANNLYYEKYIRLEDHQKRLEKPDKPKGWIKKISKKFNFQELDLLDDDEIPEDEKKIILKLFRKEKKSTLIYSYGALQAIKNMRKLLRTDGLIICSDFNATTKPGIDSYEPCYYGNSLAQAVNFEFIDRYFDQSEQKILLFEDPIKPLHTLILTHPDFEYSLQLGLHYENIFKQNIFLKAFYRYLIDLQIAFRILLIALLAFFLTLAISTWLN